MGLEYRRGRPYYYKKVWKDGTCRSEYVGGGEAALLMGQLDRIDAEEKAEARAAEAEARAPDEALERTISDYCRAVDELVDEELTRAGFHRPARKPWRRRRDGQVRV
jgi:hypothetical protein